MKRLKRIIAGVLTVVIILGYADWKEFHSVFAKGKYLEAEGTQNDWYVESGDVDDVLDDGDSPDWSGWICNNYRATSCDALLQNIQDDKFIGPDRKEDIGNYLQSYNASSEEVIKSIIDIYNRCVGTGVTDTDTLNNNTTVLWKGNVTDGDIVSVFQCFYDDASDQFVYVFIDDALRALDNTLINIMVYHSNYFYTFDWDTVCPANGSDAYTTDSDTTKAIRDSAAWASAYVSKRINNGLPAKPTLYNTMYLIKTPRVIASNGIEDEGEYTVGFHAQILTTDENWLGRLEWSSDSITCSKLNQNEGKYFDKSYNIGSARCNYDVTYVTAVSAEYMGNGGKEAIEYIEDNFSGSGISATLFSAVSTRMFNNKVDNVTGTGLDYGIASEIERVLGAIIDDLIKGYNSTLAAQNITEIPVTDIDSYEQLAAFYVSLRLDSESGNNIYKDIVNSFGKSGANLLCKTNIKEGGKIVILVTDSSLSFDVSTNTVKNVNADFYYINCKDLFSKLSDLYRSEIISDYYIVREMLGIGAKAIPSILAYNPWSRSSGAAVFNNEGTTLTSSTQHAEFVKDLIKNVDNTAQANTILAYITYTYENGVYLMYKGLYAADDVDISSPLYVNAPGLNNINMLLFDEMNSCPWIPDTLPKEINGIGDNPSLIDNEGDVSKGNGWYSFVRFLHLTAMGFECMNNKESLVYDIPIITGSGDVTYQQTYGYSAADIRAIIEKKEGAAIELTYADKNAETFNDSQICIQTLKAIIGLHDFMDCVGIPSDAWTNSIKEYYDLYDLVKDYRNNPRLRLTVSSVNTVDEPLGSFFNIAQGDMSEFWKEGYALSSIYVPFETNLYDGSTVSYDELTTDWRVFYYKYGFYRKALKVNTDSAAVVNELISGQKSGTRFATLRDLVYPNGDVVLSVDTNFYNADKVQEAVDRVDYTSLRSTTLDQSATLSEDGSAKDDNVLGNAASKIQNSIEDSLGLSAENILKHNKYKYYSQDIALNCTQMEEEAEFFDLSAHVYDAYILAPNEIITKLSESEYTPTQSFAVVSAIYRSQPLYNLMLGVLNAGNKEVFKASAGVVGLDSTNFDGEDVQYPYTYYMNYMYLEGLERLMKNTSNGQLDLDAPIFIDIFGNICTESGFVVIPAAANATLYKEDWTPYSVGFGMSVHGGEHEVEGCSTFQEWMTGLYITDSTSDGVGGIQEGYITPSAVYSNHKYGSGFFTKTLNGYMLKPTIISDEGVSVYLNWGALNVNGNDLKNVLYKYTYNNVCGDKAMYKDVILNTIVEVLRGAPIDNIDYTKEGIDNSRAISKGGVYIAYKLEDLLNTFYDNKTTNNTMVNYQSLVFATGFEYIILYVYKLAFAVMVLGLFVQIYMDSVKQQLGIRSALKFVFTVTCTLLCVTLVPDLVSWSYYKANRNLLSEDVSYLSTLSYTKALDGNEINMVSLDKPNSTSQIYIRLEDIDFDWLTATMKVLFTNTHDTVSELYAEAATSSSIANQPNVIRKGDSLYYSVNQIFEDSVLVLNKGANGTGSVFGLGYTGEGDVVSYICPYYVILQQLTQMVNVYNTDNNIEAMSVSISTGENAGHVLTYDLLTQFFNSDIFLAEGYDILGLHYILDDSSPEVMYITPPFSIEEVERMTRSLWYPDLLSDDEKADKVSKLEEEARLWVYNNKDLFGKLPDEVLLKSFSLNMAIKFNQVFNVPMANSYEIINVDSRDLFRMMIADNDKTYKYFSYGLARFTYECGGAISCICMMFYIFIDVIIGYIKMGVLIVIMGLLLFNILFRKLLFSRDGKCIEGYLISVAGLIIINYLYAFLLSVQFKLSELTSVTALIILFGILVQCIYVALLCGVVFLTIKDWKNGGYGEYTTLATAIANGVRNIQGAFRHKHMSSVNSAYASASGHKWQPSGDKDYYSTMKRNEEKRNSAGSQPDGMLDNTVNGRTFNQQNRGSQFDYEIDEESHYDRV